MSLAPKYTDKKKLLKPIVRLLKNEELFHREKINVIRSVIHLEIDNLLSDDEKKEFKGEIKMTDETERIIKQAVEEVSRKYEQEAIYDAEERVREEIAKNMKGKYHPEEIAKITGLSLKRVCELSDADN